MLRAMLAGASLAIAIGNVGAGGGRLRDPFGALAADDALLAAGGVDEGSVRLEDEAMLRELGLAQAARKDLRGSRDHGRAFRKSGRALVRGIGAEWAGLKKWMV